MSSVSCSRKLIEEGVVGNNRLVRSTGDNLDLHLVSESGAGGQAPRTKPLTCEI